MVNKFIAIAGMIAITNQASAQLKPFSIEGTIDGKSGSYIYLGYADEGTKSYRLDSSLISNGKFNFKGQLSGPVQAGLMMDKKGRNYEKYAQIYIQPSHMKLTIPYDHFSDGFVMKGSDVQNEADLLRQSRASIQAQLKPYSEAYGYVNNGYMEARKAKASEATLEVLKNIVTAAKDVMDPFYAQLRKIDEDFMNRNPSSYVTASMLRYSISRMSLKEGEERFGKLSEDVRKSALGKELRSELDELRAGSPGAKAFVFASKELRGDQLSLADYKGKYVLVDFWASWCVPCRKGNPHLLSLYSKYKSKGFEIIGVSDDDNNLDAWKKAVDQDKIGVWKHVLRGLKRVEGPEMYDRTNSISDKYGISTLPTKILIDPNGVIIGRYGGGGENDEAMDKKLAEIFGS